jgi:hypothetical protein
MKLSNSLQIDSSDSIHRVDGRFPPGTPSEGYTIAIGDRAGNYSYLYIGERELDVPVVADKLIELLDAMRWQALRRIAIKADPALEAERLGNAHTKEAVNGNQER